MVGTVSCFQLDGQANVGYWISREHWGKGIASRALELLLLEVSTRSLYAHVATSNGASLRVLQKCGFVVERVQVSPATDRYPECEEALLVGNRHDDGKRDRHQEGKHRSTALACGVDAAAGGNGCFRWTSTHAFVSSAATG